MTGELQLRLLGKPEIQRDARPITGLTSAKAQALLCYLSVTGRPHFRTSLAGLLWPDMPDANARTNLRRELSVLRGTVGDHLVISRHEVAFNPDAPYRLDVEAFERAIGLGTIDGLQEAAGLYRGDFLEGFYVRDAPAFEEWVLVLRTRLRERALQALHKLGAHYAAQGEQGLEGGIGTTSRLLALEPSREEAHRQLMSLLAQSGQRGAALAQYELCRQALAEDLGVEPGTETRELYGRIRDGDVGRRSGGLWSVRSAALRDAGAKTLPSQAMLRDAGAKTLLRIEHLPAFLSDEGRPEPERPIFVARERELAQLDGYLERALDGKGQVVFITGGPGRGKTALMTEFARRAMNRHPDLLLGMGNCNAFSGVGDPYLSFREVLAMLTGDVEARWASGAISRAHACRLWEALPQVLASLLDHGPHLIGSLLPGPNLLSRASVAIDNACTLDQLQEWTERDLSAQSDLQQDAVFEQYTNVLRALAGQRPLLVTLDDLQWVDIGSTSLAFHLGRRLADNGGRILILGTFRPEELALGDAGGRHPLEKVLHEFERRFGDICVDLSTPDVAQGTLFVDALLDSPASPLARNRLDDDFRAALARHTGGHALFTTEVLRDLQERGDLGQDAQGYWTASPALDWGELPPRVEAVIKDRVDRLAPELRQLLQVASVEGERFTAQVVAQVQGLGERETLRALSDVLGSRHRLLLEAGEERTGDRYLSRYQFAHALFQAYLYNGLSPGERRLLHREVGFALEAQYEGHTDEIAAQLASHFAGAGDSNLERRYTKVAGERAAAGYAWEQAVRYLSRALDLTPEGDRDERFTILLARERMHGFHGDRESQAADLAMLNELAGGPEDDQQAAARRALAVLRRARYAEATDDLPAGIKLSQSAIEYARTARDKRVEGEGYWNWGLVLHKQGDPAGARSRFEQGLALARMTKHRWLEAGCVRAVGCICRDQEDFEAARTYLQDALSISREIGDLEGEARAVWHLGVTSSAEGDTATAIDFLQQAAVISRRIGYRPAEADALSSLGWHLICQSRYAEAQSCLESALHIYREIELPGGQANALNGLGRLHREYTGDYERSRTYGEEASRLCQAAGYPFVAAVADFVIGFAHHYQGDYCTATPHMSRFLGFTDNRDLRRAQTALGLVGVGLNAMALGDYAVAEARLLDARTTAREVLVAGHDDVAWIESALALLYHQMGDDQKALGYAQRAVAIHRHTGHDCRAGTALNRLGHALTAPGDLDEAAAAYQDALDLRRKLGQSHLAPESLAGLARMALTRGEARAALVSVEQILDHLQSRGPSSGTACPIDGTDEPMRVYLTCYRVLRANADPRAEEILEEAYSLLQRRADKIDDPDLRRSYLENVAANRELVALRTDPKGF